MLENSIKKKYRVWYSEKPLKSKKEEKLFTIVEANSAADAVEIVKQQYPGYHVAKAWLISK
ncbi:MAG: hypothetical protein N2489_04090 [Clostridia bacterium]|nr:hypothetical protein [Clostridia bacterium]